MRVIAVVVVVVVVVVVIVAVVVVVVVVVVPVKYPVLIRASSHSRTSKVELERAQIFEPPWVTKIEPVPHLCNRNGLLSPSTPFYISSFP